MDIVFLVIGLIIGFIIGWLVFKTRSGKAVSTAELENLQSQLQQVNSEKTRLEERESILK